MYIVKAYDDTETWTELETFSRLEDAKRYARQTARSIDGWFAAVVLQRVATPGYAGKWRKVYDTDDDF